MEKSLERLRELAYQDLTPARQAQAWEVLSKLDAPDELTVATDYAQSHGMATELDAERLSGLLTARLTRKAWVCPTTGGEFVWIPAGSFIKGPSDALERVSLPGFAMARHPVTNRQYARFIAKTGYTSPNWQPHPHLNLQHWDNDGACPEALLDHPVSWVSWPDAEAYCRWANLMMPTGDMWEKASRGPDGSTYPWGDQPPQPELAHFRQSGTCPVNAYNTVRTAYGCRNTIGNVEEWCAPDLGAQTPIPQEPLKLEAALVSAEASSRGGGYKTHPIADRLACANARPLTMIRRNAWLGFRPALARLSISL